MRHRTQVDDRDALFNEFAPLMRSLIRRYGADPELREELMGEIYFRFSALLDAYDPTRGIPLRAYLVRQLSTSVFTYVRHHWRVRRREAELEALTLECERAAKWDPTPTWDAAIMLDEVASHLPAAISRLPRRQSEVLVSRYFEDRSYDDIADEMGVQSATVRSLLRHALNHLRGQFREKFAEDFDDADEARELAGSC